MQLLTVPSMSLACEVPDFDESIVGGSGQVETRRRETNVSHIPARSKEEACKFYYSNIAGQAMHYDT